MTLDDAKQMFSDFDEPARTYLANAFLQRINATIDAQNIPGWATWPKETALAWIDTNIGAPLATGRATLPATLTLASTRIVIVKLLDILDAILVLLTALTKMAIALRNKEWPGMQVTQALK